MNKFPPLGSSIQSRIENGPDFILVWTAWPTLAHVPGKLDVPVILYAGELCFFRDATKQMKSLFQNSLYCERPGRNHFELMMESDWISRNVIAFFPAL